jgi:pilus assembly protein CpaF
MASNVILEIRRPEKPPKSQTIADGAYSVGADDENQIILPHDDVAARHAILVVGADGWWVEDLNDPSRTLIDGTAVAGRANVTSGQQIQIGPYALLLHVSNGESVPPPPPATPAAQPPLVVPEPMPEDPREAQILSIKQQIHTELLNRLDLKRMIAMQAGEGELHQRAKATIGDIVNEVRDRLPDGTVPEELIKEIYDEAIGLGPLEDLIADESITEIMVNGHDHVYVERAGRVERTGRRFLNNDSVLAIIERIVSPIGRRIDESQPYVDARLRDGSRVNAIIPPLSLVGPCLTIRKFSKEPFTDEDLIRFGSLERFVADFLRVCVLVRKNIIVAGGTGTGKTTLLNVLSNYLPEEDRIVTIEDAAELRLNKVHVVRLEARPPNIEGRGAITIRDLVRNSLRMRPDRIVVGECRGGEALDMLQAMNTGHDGSLTTVHANTPRDVISRIETMVLMSGMDLPVRAIREQISSAVDVILQISRFSDGTRKVVSVTEVVGQEGDQITMQELFAYKQTGIDADGRIAGEFVPTGAVPVFIEDIRAANIAFDQRMLDPQQYRSYGM